MGESRAPQVTSNRNKEEFTPQRPASKQQSRPELPLWGTVSLTDLEVETQVSG